MAIAKEVPQAVMNRSDGKRLLALSQRLPKESIQLFYQIALHGRRDLYLSPTARGGFEMTMLRLLAFEPERSNVSEKKTIKSTEQGLSPSTSSASTSRPKTSQSPSHAPNQIANAIN